MLSNETDGILINPHEGCSSPLGRQGGIQSLSLANGCDSMATIMHEFMHALGVHHTQARSDRDDYITILKQNLDADVYETNFAMVNDYQFRNRVKSN